MQSSLEEKATGVSTIKIKPRMEIKAGKFPLTGVIIVSMNIRRNHHLEAKILSVEGVEGNINEPQKQYEWLLEKARLFSIQEVIENLRDEFADNFDVTTVDLTRA